MSREFLKKFTTFLKERGLTFNRKHAKTLRFYAVFRMKRRRTSLTEPVLVNHDQISAGA
jgi:hypothetical protein